MFDPNDIYEIVRIKMSGRRIYRDHKHNGRFLSQKPDVIIFEWKKSAQNAIKRHRENMEAI